MKNVLIWVLLVIGFHSYAQTECKLDKDRDGIKVHICSTKGKDLKSVRVVFIARNATIAELERIIDDVPGFVNWQYQVIEASILERKGADEMVYRTRLSTPVLIDDREMIVRLKKSKDPNVRRLDITIVNDPFPYPESEDLVRVPFSKTTWTIIALSENSIHVTYTISMDPGGVLPTWVVNEALTVGPFETFSNLKKMLERGIED